ncbi:MAG: hypothetical protein QXM16_02135 [Nitrososphaerota archaeon]
MSSKKPLTSECILCGEPLPILDAMTTRYPCLTTCTRLVNSKHLRECHGEYFKQSERNAPFYFYTFLASSLSAMAAFLTGNILAAQLLVVFAAVSLSLGTVVRRRLIKRYAIR